MAVKLTENEWTIEKFEKFREECIQKNSVFGDDIHTLGLFEGLQEISRPINTKEKVYPRGHGRLETLRLLERKYNDKILNIEFREIIRHSLSKYGAFGQFEVLETQKESLLETEPTVLFFWTSTPELLINNIDYTIFLLQVYKEALNSASYKKRIGQK